MNTNKIRTLLAAALAALVVGAVPALADGGSDGGDHELPACASEGTCHLVGIVYDNDIDGPAAHALASLNTANGIPTVALPTNDDLTNPGSMRDAATVECWILMGPGTLGNSGATGLTLFSRNEADARIVGVDRYATAEQAGRAVRTCNGTI